MSMHLAATLLLVVFVTLAAVDGIYVHLLRLRLHARPQSWLEHLWHTASAVLFLPAVAAIFLAPTGGALLFAGIGSFAAIHAVEVLDVKVERSSRADIGGLSRAELSVHVALVVVRTLAIALSLAARPVAAWSLDAPWIVGSHTMVVTALVAALIPGAIAAAAVHVWLAWRHRPEVCCLPQPA
jgi:hypothetical protein